MVRYNPFREIEQLQNALLRNFFTPTTESANTPLVDALEDAQGIHLAVYLPGVEPSNVEVTTENNTLTIRAERPFNKPENASQWRLEGPYGKFERSFVIPNTFDLGKIEATFKHGILYLDIPKAEAAQPRRIEVRVNP
ncbi:Hsp20/alpha crystallin family protein [Meiothermus taiwanensis]|jgi:HSP20 family protein|uniref:18 kDa heat shock protein n=2 Tax=Meiothermus taiwanensis TaxID=172827 RepID=A0A399DXF8_9DEIN|nr:Hsp20/alpha crystallin family protein [Meiothermus taiwanensis]AWR87339.1 heat shock protein Hsp20 [Meiothermus taiwanensis WR-220]KIQ54616.1 heat-shock protein Hsp20 [Meiothermus taiwanensis]KZK15692.1 heat-shock protein Hsp20 [Meiothermus taiwanensis]RIH76063.1 18 kDa heat shock protein [Meiothermus taiwanensis]